MGRPFYEGKKGRREESVTFLPLVFLFLFGQSQLFNAKARAHKQRLLNVTHYLPKCKCI